MRKGSRDGMICNLQGYKTWKQNDQEGPAIILYPQIYTYIYMSNTVNTICSVRSADPGIRYQPHCRFKPSPHRRLSRDLVCETRLKCFHFTGLPVLLKSHRSGPSATLLSQHQRLEDSSLKFLHAHERVTQYVTDLVTTRPQSDLTATAQRYHAQAISN